MTALETEALPPAQQLLLWAMRMWVAQMKTGADHAGQIAAALEEQGCLAAAAPLEQMMHALSTSCTRMIDVRCACHGTLGDDERALLDLFSHAQSFDYEAARVILSRFTAPAEAATILHAAEQIGTVLLANGRSLPCASSTAKTLDRPPNPSPPPAYLH